ncbi:hypothetical protein [Pedobacter sp. MW01-1-1]|uniref:hypothetical protein n=1 Tax=Pedobacter sp. MW01-1-1 TaxID=3383027 RepID=UPI003FF016D9
MNFNIDFNKLITWLVPHFLVKPNHLAWLKTLLFPVVWLYSEFLAYRAEKLYDATINSQVNRLTHALRKRFNNQSIYIIHLSDYTDQAFIFLEIEGATLEYDYLAMEGHTPLDYDFLQAEYDNEVDFIVRIPIGMAALSEEVKAFVNLYKFSSKRFKIETF